MVKYFDCKSVNMRECAEMAMMWICGKYTLEIKQIWQTIVVNTIILLL